LKRKRLSSFQSDVRKKEEKKKRKRERGKGKEKEAKKRSGLADGEEPEGNRAEQTEDKKDCPFEDNSVCPVTYMIC